MKELLKAVSSVVASVGHISKGSEGQYGNYASLDDILAILNPALKEAGLIIMHRYEGMSLITELIHIESGETVSSRITLVLDKDNVQSIGASTTYLRRYSILSLLGLATYEDPDQGAQAVQPKKSFAKTFSPSSVVKSVKQDLTSDEMVISFGKYRGRGFTDLDPAEAIRYADWLEESSRTSGKGMHKNAHAFVTWVDQNLKNKPPPPTEEFSSFSNDEIPF